MKINVITTLSSLFRINDVLFGDIFEDHVNINIETSECANQLFVAFHYDPDF